MDVSNTPALERIARVLAGQRLSHNAQGVSISASDEVDARWREFLPDATAVLKTLREPDEAMTASGDLQIWNRMITVALGGEVRGPTPQPAIAGYQKPLG